MTRVGTLPAIAITNRQQASPMLPPTIQGLRRPQRPVVRSESRPKIGLPSRAAMAPMPRMMPWAAGARSSPTTVVTLMAMLTVTGPSSAMNNANWAKANVTISLPPAGSVGGAMPASYSGSTCS